MRKLTALLLAGALCLGLTGCAPLPPEKAADGQDWDKGWVTVGEIVGVDTPDGLNPQENNEALSIKGMYYATWSAGEGEPYTNKDGKDATLYDAQVYLLLSGCDSEQAAGNTLTQWQEMAQLNYVIGSTNEESYGGVDFTVITYTFDSEDNPYARGASAFGLYRNYALSVELTCREEFAGDPAELLGQFLDNCHYAMP